MSSVRKARRVPSDQRVRPTRAQTRERLLGAARELIAEYGYGGASVEAICEHAGFTRGAFYSNFDSKDELVCALYDEHYARVRAQVAAALAEVATTPTGLDDAVRRVFDAVRVSPADRRQWALLDAEFTLHALRNDTSRARWVALQRRFRQELAALIDAGWTRLGLRLSLSGTDLARFVLAVHAGMTAQRLLDPDDESDERLECVFVSAAMQGLNLRSGWTDPR